MNSGGIFLRRSMAAAEFCDNWLCIPAGTRQTAASDSFLSLSQVPFLGRGLTPPSSSSSLSTQTYYSMSTFVSRLLPSNNLCVLPPKSSFRRLRGIQI